jgi:hypothetical protein
VCVYILSKMPPIGSLGQKNNNNNNTDNIHKSGGVTKPQKNNTDKKLLHNISTLLIENTILKTEKKNQKNEIEELQLQLELYKATHKILLEANKSLKECIENRELVDKNNQSNYEILLFEFKAMDQYTFQL